MCQFCALDHKLSCNFAASAYGCARRGHRSFCRHHTGRGSSLSRPIVKFVGFALSAQQLWFFSWFRSGEAPNSPSKTGFVCPRKSTTATSIAPQPSHRNARPRAPLADSNESAYTRKPNPFARYCDVDDWKGAFHHSAGYWFLSVWLLRCFLI